MNNSFGKRTLFVFLTFLVFFVLSACGTTTTTTTQSSTTTTTLTTSGTSSSTTLSTASRVVISISLTDPTPDAFYSGEFSLTSVAVVVLYDDESTEEISLAYSMLSVDITLLSPGSHQVIVTYEGCEAVLTLIVLEPVTEYYSLFFHLDEGILGEGIEESFWNLADGTLATLPIPTKLGFLFLGWYEDPEFEYGPFFETYEVSSDQHLYALWEETTVLIDAILSEFLLGDNHTISTFITYTENYEVIRLDVVLSYLATVEGNRLENAVTNRLDYGEGGPWIYPEYHVRSILETDDFRYVYEKEYEENYGIFSRINTQILDLGVRVDTSDSPFDVLDPSAFVRRAGEFVYDYVAVGNELAQFAHAVYDGDFVEDEVFAVLTCDPMGFALGIPLSPFDEGMGGWPAMITIEYQLSDIDTTSANFPIDEVSAAVMNELTTIFNARVETLYPTAQSLADYQQMLTNAQTLLLSLDNVEDLYLFYQAQQEEFINFVLFPDPLQLMKVGIANEIAGPWAWMSFVATDASLAQMTLDYETMMGSIEAAETESEAMQAYETGWKIVCLGFIEDSDKAEFYRRQAQAYSDLTQFEILFDLTVLGSDPNYQALHVALEAAKDTILGLAYPSDPSLHYAILRAHLLDLYHDCTLEDFDFYKAHALWVVEESFFTYATSQQDYWWDALMLFSAERDKATSLIQSATSGEAMWNAVLDYLHASKDIADEAWREDFIETYYDTFNDFYYRLNSAYSGTFTNEYIVLRDRMNGAILSESFPFIDLQFDFLLANAVLDEVKNARRDAIGTIQALLIILNPIATQTSQTAMYVAQNDGYDALYASTTLGEVETVLSECLAAINAAYIEDSEKAALAAARSAALAELEDYLHFSSQFVSQYSLFNDILILGFDSIQWIPGQYTVTEVKEHLDAFYADVATIGFAPDAGLVESYRSWALTDLDAWIALLATVPAEIAEAYENARTTILTVIEPFAMRVAHDGFVAQVQPLL